METAVIRKRLSTFKCPKGTLREVANDVVLDVLRGWETWPGKTIDYYREIGLSKMQLAIMIKKGKKLVKSGAVSEGEFRELSLPMGGGAVLGASSPMEVHLAGGKAVKFSQVDHLVDFLKKMT